METRAELEADARLAEQAHFDRLEGICPECRGEFHIRGFDCEECGGTGYVDEPTCEECGEYPDDCTCKQAEETP